MARFLQIDLTVSSSKPKSRQLSVIRSIEITRYGHIERKGPLDTAR